MSQPLSGQAHDPVQGWPILGHDGTVLRIISVDATGKIQLAAGGSGGTQYTEGDVDGTITGNALVWEADNTTNTLRTVNVNNPLPVQFSNGTSLVTAADPANNALRVNIVAGAGSGGTALADKAAFTEGTTSGTPIEGVYNETLGADPSEDSVVAIRSTVKRALHVNLRNVSGTELGTAGAPVRTDPTGSTAQPVTDNGGSLTVDNADLTSLAAIAKAEDVAHISGDSGVMALAVRKDTAAALAGTDGDYSPLQVDATGRLYITGAYDTAVAYGAGGVKFAAVGGLDGAATFRGQAMSSDGGAMVAGIVGGVAQSARVHDSDTGAGTEYNLGVSLRKAANGGSVELGTGTDPVRVDPTGTTAQPVTDNGGALTVDNAGTFAVQAAQSGTWNTRMQDGSGNALASGTTDAAGTEQAIYVRPIPGSTTQLISGTINGSVSATQSGTWVVRTQDGSGNALASTTGNPAATDRGLTVKEPGFATFEAQHVTLVASTDTTITFSATVSAVRIVNWDTSNILLVKDGAIASDTDSASARVGVASASNLPSTRVFPIETGTIHLRSAGTNAVTVEGFR